MSALEFFEKEATKTLSGEQIPISADLGVLTEQTPSVFLDSKADEPFGIVKNNPNAAKQILVMDRVLILAPFLEHDECLLYSELDIFKADNVTI